ncbi:hypothetical protein MUY27_12425 [Mucilaginibacter sp. RS28]|uniref:Lipoprotein n=1 Tax=Mucilaginibacter straminoryzae TaxID=2932774 RepID=A0A9X1X4Z9_9SPHI|nr:hypothetical protein [Mucilaginibacter straminoryzae]MCJ8210515.1 hypothetical protein [Mucilaginibacter straminoryzae]
MKKNLYLLLLILAGALAGCKKDSQPVQNEKVKKIEVEIPSDPTGGQQPVAGVPQTPGNPDITSRTLNLTVGYSKPVFLDANNDGTSDFTFTTVLVMHDDKSHLYFFANPNTRTESKVLLQQGTELKVNGLWAYPFNQDDAIAPNTTLNNDWNEFGVKPVLLAIDDDKTVNGLWKYKSDKYLGIRLKINGNFHYGWVKISHQQGSEEMQITEFAYQTKSGQAIKAGEK